MAAQSLGEPVGSWGPLGTGRVSMTPGSPWAFVKMGLDGTAKARHGTRSAKRREKLPAEISGDAVLCRRSDFCFIRPAKPPVSNWI